MFKLSSIRHHTTDRHKEQPESRCIRNAHCVLYHLYLDLSDHIRPDEQTNQAAMYGASATTGELFEWMSSDKRDKRNIPPALFELLIGAKR